MLTSYKYKYPFLTSLMSAMDFCGRCKKTKIQQPEVKSCVAGRCFVLQETKGGGFFDGNSLCPNILVMVPEIPFPTTWNFW